MINPKPRSKTLVQRIKEHLFFSVAMMTGIFVLLSLAGIKARFGSLVLSILLTLVLNVGLSYYYESRAKKREEQLLSGTKRTYDSDIRFRD